jgi:hypothetical protein
MATLMEEILLTRIFSVTMWYHFAFVAISVAMFGMTVGALLVYLFPASFAPERTADHLALSALFFAIFVAVSILIEVHVPFIFQISIGGFLSAASMYSAASLPFVFSGICVCLALTRFPARISSLYAADLAGAALGCILVIFMLRATDGPTAVVAVAALGALASLLFARPSGVPRRLRSAAALTCLGLAGVVAVNTLLVWRQASLLRVEWIKGGITKAVRPIYTKWNSFSRVTVNGNPDAPMAPVGWGISPAYHSDYEIPQLDMEIDSGASTILTQFRGDLSKVDYLRYDVTNVVHYIRPGSSILIVGTGGGRDVLSALVFDQKRIIGVEMNPAILYAANRRFGDFTGHLDRYPQVQFINDEARSFITRQKQKFGIIQISLVDTWAATAAGALVLTENNLYTLQAWRIFLNHLTPDGVLSVSRWYPVQGEPVELYRLASLAGAALRQAGAQNPRSHIVILGCKVEGKPWRLSGIGTILVSRAPFSDQDLDRIEAVANKMKFQIVLTPRTAPNLTVASLAEGKNLSASSRTSPYNLAPPTDDKPFFFFSVRFRDILNPRLWRAVGLRNAVFVLLGLLVVVTVLTLGCIVVPLFFRTGPGSLAGAAPHLVYFGAIGLGFMFVEISQMQRLMIFLGQPTYGLSVVLFSLLLSSGIGSFATRAVAGRGRQSLLWVSLAGLTAVLIIFGLLTPALMEEFRASTTPVRILVSVAILFPLGLMMGAPFPLGMRQAAGRAAPLMPWLWGINGATSVLASVLAMVIALTLGISAAFWTGFWCYAIAVATFFIIESKPAALGSGKP